MIIRTEAGPIINIISILLTSSMLAYISSEFSFNQNTYHLFDKLSN